MNRSNKTPGTGTTGYVYILTNPSFNENWVKIGKSSRPVDVRSKELDNTAVPLPFEIYATMQTAKYAEVERIIHKQIDRLTDLRIRQSREFFNVHPAQALEILTDLAQAIENAGVMKYEEGKPHQLYPVNEVPKKKNRREETPTCTFRFQYGGTQYWRHRHLRPA